MNIHFSIDEFERRQNLVKNALAERNLDGLLLFKIEDIYWLTGADTDGFYVFSCMFISTDGRMSYLTRAVDLSNVAYSSIINDVRIWEEKTGYSRGKAIKKLLNDFKMENKRVGIQLDSLGIRADLYIEIKEELDGWCKLVPASDITTNLRLVKSQAEIDYLKKSAEICNKLVDIAIDETFVGAFEGDIFGKLITTIYKYDGDPPALRNPMGCGKAASNGRYTTKRNYVEKNDLFSYELGCGYRHYHTACMFSVLTGPDVDPEHVKMHNACKQVLDEIQKVIRPGNLLGDIFDTQKKVFAEFGYEKENTIKSVGYSMGATFPPTWVDPPMLIKGDKTIIKENMTLFTHPGLRAYGTKIAVGEQFIVGKSGAEAITHVPRKLVIK